MSQIFTNDDRRRTLEAQPDVSTGAVRQHTALVLLGGLALIGAILVAHATPASGYEVNIYTATPALYWVGIGITLLCSIVVLTAHTESVQWAGAAVLAAIAGLSVAALPLIRGYYYYGLGDPLGHLGKAHNLLDGTFTFFTDYYLASHVFSNVLAVMGGAEPRRAMMLFVFLTLTLFVLFSTLSVRAILPTRTATGIALLSALMFLPINHVGLGPMFHTYSITTFFFPFVMYILLKHITSDGRDPTLAWGVSATDLGFLFAGLSLNFFHPQVAANVIILMGSIVFAQVVARRWYPNSLFGSSKPLYGQFLVLTFVFLAWNLQFSALFDLSGTLYQSVLGLLGGSEQAGAIVNDRAASAEGTGTSIYMLFLNLFLVQAFYAVVAILVVCAKLLGFIQNRSPESDVTVQAFSISGISLAVFFLFHFIGSVSGYFFRHLGFGIVLATVVAVIGLASATRSLSYLRRRTKQSLGGLLRGIAIVLVVLTLVHSIAVVYPSPFISLPSSHVSEQQYVGHNTGIEYAADHAAFASPRAPPDRESEASGRDVDNRLMWGVEAEAMNSQSGLRDVRKHYWPQKDYYYFFVSETDRQRETVAYNEYRYSTRSFKSVSRQEGASRVFSNGEVEMYQVLYSSVEDRGPGE